MTMAELKQLQLCDLSRRGDDLPVNIKNPFLVGFYIPFDQGDFRIGNFQTGHTVVVNTAAVVKIRLHIF